MTTLRTAPALCLRGHADAVRSVVILPGGNSLLSGGYDGTVRQWDARTGAAKGSLPVQAGKIEALAFSGPGNRLAIAGGRLRLRQADSKLLTLPGHRGPVLCVAFSAEGTATGCRRWSSAPAGGWPFPAAATGPSAAGRSALGKPFPGSKGAECGPRG